MSAISMAFSVEGLPELLRVAGTLKSVSSETFTNDLAKKVQTAAGPLASALRSAATSIPATQGVMRRDGQQLRGALSQAVTVTSLPTGVRVFVDSTQMPEGARQMAFAFDKANGWDHPVFGRGRTHQSGHPWFRVTCTRYQPEMIAAGEKSVTDVGHSLGL